MPRLGDRGRIRKKMVSMGSVGLIQKNTERWGHLEEFQNGKKPKKTEERKGRLDKQGPGAKGGGRYT